MTGSAGQLLAALRAVCVGGEGGAGQEDCRDARVLSPGCISAQVRNICVPVLLLCLCWRRGRSSSKRLSGRGSTVPRVHISSGEEHLCAGALAAACAGGEGGARQKDCLDEGVLSPGCISAQVRNICVPVLSLLPMLAEREELVKKIVVTREYCPQGAFKLR